MAKRTCTIDGCTKPENARGWCKGHYYRWGRYGDPLGSAPPRPPRPAKVRDTCTVGDCDGPQYARGWCENHYARFRRHGGLHDKRAETGDPVERFWSKVSKTDTCWLWTGTLNGSGYGSFAVAGRTVGAHVYAVLIDGREVPPGMELDHLCRVRRCVRPDHLEAVTHVENERRKRITT